MSDNINIQSQSTDPPAEPLTREERYLSAIAGVTSSEDIPEKPLTREEKYLNKIVENGGGGGSSFEPTDEQLAAMNSGITSEDVEQIETNKNNISNIQTAISIDNITSNISANTGYTIVTGMSAVYKQGKHIFGNIIVKKDDNPYTANVEETIAVISNKPSAHVTTFCGFSTSEWNIKNIGYVFFSSSTGDIKVINSTAGNTTVNIHIDYCIS